MQMSAISAVMAGNSADEDFSHQLHQIKKQKYWICRAKRAQREVDTMDTQALHRVGISSSNVKAKKKEEVALGWKKKDDFLCSLWSCVTTSTAGTCSLRLESPPQNLS